MLFFFTLLPTVLLMQMCMFSKPWYVNICEMFICVKWCFPLLFQGPPQKNHGCITNWCNIFAFAFLKIHYKVDVGGGTAIAETPEIERVKRNQQTISTVHYCVTLPQPFPTHHISLLLITAKIAQDYYLSVHFNHNSLHFINFNKHFILPFKRKSPNTLIN